MIVYGVCMQKGLRRVSLRGHGCNLCAVVVLAALAGPAMQASAQPACAADITHDGAVGPADLLQLLASWGGTQGDITGDGVVGPADLLALLSSWGGACVRPEPFRLFPTPVAPTGSNPIVLAVADVNNDGALDVLTANGIGSMSVLLNNGSGLFDQRIDIFALFSANTIAVGDVNGDTFVDAVVGSTSQATSVVLLGDGTGDFSLFGSINFSARALGDLDGDGDLDATGDHGGVSLNNGDATFALGQFIQNGSGTRASAIGDLDNDGDLDIVLSGQFRDVSITLNNGDATFAPAISLGSSNDGPLHLVDLDSDGNLDIITFNGVFFGTGAGAFDTITPLSASPLGVGDLDGDGDADIVGRLLQSGVEQFAFLRNDGQRVFTSMGSAVFDISFIQFSSVTIADANGDGANDVLFVRGGEGGAGVLFNQGAGNFISRSELLITGASFSAMNGADFDGDNDVDFVLTPSRFNTGTGSIFVMSNDGFGNMQVRAEILAGPSPGDIASADIDADGDIDFAVTNSDNAVTLFKNNGTGLFTQSLRLAVGGTPTALAFADIDGDLNIDLIVTDTTNGAVVVFRNNGTGNYVPGAAFAAGADPVALSLVDLDGDLDIDIAVANGAPGTVTVLLNEGDGFFPSSASFSAGDLPSDLAIADFDSDGDQDIAVSTKGVSDAVTILLNTGAGGFTPHAQFKAGVGPSSIAAADVDNDGAIDLIVGNQFSATVSLLRNIGGGDFATQHQFASDFNLNDLVVADVDGDGDTDVATVSDSSLSILRNQFVP